MTDRRRGRPRLAAEVSNLPSTRVPAAVHDALVREASRRRIAVARVIREAVIRHLHNPVSTPVVQNSSIHEL